MDAHSVRPQARACSKCTFRRGPRLLPGPAFSLALCASSSPARILFKLHHKEPNAFRSLACPPGTTKDSDTSLHKPCGFQPRRPRTRLCAGDHVRGWAGVGARRAGPETGRTQAPHSTRGLPHNATPLLPRGYVRGRQGHEVRVGAVKHCSSCCADLRRLWSPLCGRRERVPALSYPIAQQSMTVSAQAARAHVAVRASVCLLGPLRVSGEC